jgi:hypothetical protein
MGSEVILLSAAIIKALACLVSAVLFGVAAIISALRKKR